MQVYTGKGIDGGDSISGGKGRYKIILLHPMRHTSDKLMRISFLWKLMCTRPYGCDRIVYNNMNPIIYNIYYTCNIIY